ncbi:MAG TPA: hypothetical protein VHQ45_14655, partial [Gemmatimonadaceae bacterium]|nr:hypothetical protein [Gemmatimonadaceae bacterium]
MIQSPARSPRRPWRTALLVAALAAASSCHDDPTAPGSARLVVDVRGLPARVSAALTVSGPGGFERSITSGVTLSPLAPGGYLVRAADVVVGDVTYQASPAAESVFVDRARELSVSVSYAPRAAGNFSIARLTFVQSVQTPDTRVPLVAGRDALLRVFVLAGADGARFPQLRVRYYRDGVLLESSTVASSSGTVPTQLSDFPLRNTMNVVVPAALVQPGLQITADVDPDNAIGEETEQDNRWPRDGGLVAVSVRAVPPLRLRLVPVAFGGVANAGRVSSQTMAAFVGFARELYPLGAAEVDVRAPFAASA